MIEKFEIDGILYSIILRADFHQEEGIEFFTPKEFSQQLASMKRPAGYRIKPHLHNQNIREVVFTKETLVIKSGTKMITLSIIKNVNMSSKATINATI